MPVYIFYTDEGPLPFVWRSLPFVWRSLPLRLAFVAASFAVHCRSLPLRYINERQMKRNEAERGGTRNDRGSVVVYDVARP